MLRSCNGIHTRRRDLVNDAARPLIPVILCGGAGTRLWPVSRVALPKPFITIAGRQSLLADTLQRVRTLEDAGNPLIVGEARHLAHIEAHLADAGMRHAQIVLEPEARGTTPAIAAAALEARARDPKAPEPVLAVMPCDHAIDDTTAWNEALRRASEEARRGRLVCLGVVAQNPDTDYGYIEVEGRACARAGVQRIVRFREKPDAETAARWVTAGHVYWNSGIFVFGARTVLAEIEQHCAQTLRAVAGAHAAARKENNRTWLAHEAFAQAPMGSFDRCVMEHVRDARVVCLDAHWSDLGNWTRMSERAPRDASANTVVGDAVLAGVHNSYVHAPQRLVTLAGLDDVVVIDTADAVLVAGKNASGDVHRVVARLADAGRDEIAEPSAHRRAWGEYTVLAQGPRWKVKRLSVRPGARISLQMHRRRAEHWVVVRGCARVTCEEKTFTLEANTSADIPQGARHRLENCGTDVLEVIEVQTGDYLGEDDIVRFDTR